MIRTAEPNDYAAEILFYLPRADDPRLPKLAHTFVLGEVQIKLTPGGAWVDVALDRIVERGRGWYAIRLTAPQRATAGEVAYRAVCAGAQPDVGTEVIGELGGDIPQGASGYVPFFLPNEDDPVYGAPVEGHTFVLGEVELSLPDDAFGDVDPEDVVEFGGGLYGVLLDESQAAKRGKAIVVATVAGAQRASSARTILGDGSLVSSPVAPLLPAGAGSDGSEAVAGDVRLTWSNTLGDADLTRTELDADIAADQGLETAALLSLFTDRRAEDDDVPPSGDPNDRRGWWGDEFAEVKGDRYGSRLWLLDRSKRTNETALRAKEYVREAFAWMLEDRVVSRIEVEVEVEVTAHVLWIAPALHRPGRDPVTFRFAHTWDHQEEAA